ncbi:MAG: SRPBCC domain-containing protein [Halioglobus sp.]
MRDTINTQLFSNESDLRQFEKRSVVNASVSDVYAAWTNGGVFCRIFDPSNTSLAANIELEIGGKYEWLWDGETGSNDCQVLSFIPDRMVSFSWNAPPDQPMSRALRTWVVVEFSTIDNANTEVTLTHLGFGSAPHWEQTRSYFTAAWDTVLSRFQENLSQPNYD